MSVIPSLNLHDFTRGDAAQRAHFVRSLGQAYEEVGFVAVSGHALSDALSDALYAEVRRFFALENSVKLQYEVAGLAGQRGYTSFGREHAKGRTAGDLKEFFQFGQEPDPSDPVFGEYPQNVRVSELPDFHRLAMEAYRALESSGRSILQAIALFLGLPERYFDAHIEAGNSILRAIHYGPITEEPRDAVRAAEHEDINLITLLMGASADGLEVLSREGSWVPVTALPNQVVVNVGDMLQRLTNNRLKSTTHRVVNPPRALWGTSRFSIPFFLHPRSAMPLDCLPECIDEAHPRAYPPITAGEYLDERLREIGLKA